MESKFIYRYAPKKSGGLDEPERAEVVAIRNAYASFGGQRSVGERNEFPVTEEKTGRRREKQ